MPPSAQIRRQRGAAMVVVVLVAGLVAILLTGYVHLSLNGLELAERSFHTTGAVNLAELGLEEAMYCYNRLGSVGTPADAWTGWTLSGNTATRTFSGFTQGTNASGSVKVYCEHYNPSGGSTPVVVAQSTVTLPGGPPITKTIEVKVKRRSSVFTGGLIARGSNTLQDNNKVDAWMSDPDHNPATPFVPYSSGVRTDKAIVATASAVDGALGLLSSGVEVYGRVASGGGTVNIFAGATVHDATSPASPAVDPDLVTTDFAASFPEVTVPTPAVVNVVGASITASTTFPRAGDLSNTDGRYYYGFAAGANISINGGMTININGGVTFLFQNHNGSTAIELLENNILTIGAAGSLHVYTQGNINVDSNSLWNETREPGACLIYGTNPTIGGQTILVDRNAHLHAGVYAPNANVSALRNGWIRGSVVGNTIFHERNVVFSYDESLQYIGSGTLVFGLGAWRELRTAAERAVYAGQLSF